MFCFGMFYCNVIAFANMYKSNYQGGEKKIFSCENKIISEPATNSQKETDKINKFKTE